MPFLVLLAACAQLWVFRTIDKVDKTMADIQEQTQLATEISEQISTGPLGADLDDVGYLLVCPSAMSGFLMFAFRMS